MFQMLLGNKHIFRNVTMENILGYPRVVVIPCHAILRYVQNNAIGKTSTV